MSPTRKTALIAGALFVITFLTSIPAALLLYTPVLDHTNYIVSAGADTRVALGAFLEVLLIIANVGSAVVLFPVLKRQNEPVALGYVTARIIESTFIAIGIVSLLAVVTLRQKAAGADAGSLVTVGKSLVAVRNWTFVLGPGFECRRRKRADPGLPDVPIRPRSAGHGHVGTRRRYSGLRFGPRRGV
jgi:Domain of unknown function (DUF4386)